MATASLPRFIRDRCPKEYVCDTCLRYKDHEIKEDDSDCFACRWCGAIIKHTKTRILDHPKRCNKMPLRYPQYQCSCYLQSQLSMTRAPNREVYANPKSQWTPPPPKEDWDKEDAEAKQFFKRLSQVVYTRGPHQSKQARR